MLLSKSHRHVTHMTHVNCVVGNRATGAYFLSNSLHSTERILDTEVLAKGNVKKCFL